MVMWATSPYNTHFDLQQPAPEWHKEIFRWEKQAFHPTFLSSISPIFLPAAKPSWSTNHFRMCHFLLWLLKICFQFSIHRNANIWTQDGAAVITSCRCKAHENHLFPYGSVTFLLLPLRECKGLRDVHLVIRYVHNDVLTDRRVRPEKQSGRLFRLHPPSYSR